MMGVAKYDWDLARAAAAEGRTAKEIAALIGAKTACQVAAWIRRNGVGMVREREAAKRDTRTLEQKLVEAFAYDKLTGNITRKNLAIPYGRNVGRVAGTLRKDGYVEIKFARRHIKAHRLAWLLATGAWPSVEIDHINGARDDNRWVNLRQCSDRENCRNSGWYTNNTSGFRGVFRSHDGTFKASIRHGKSIHLGTFSTAQEASVAYEAAARRLHGEFYRPPELRQALSLQKRTTLQRQAEIVGSCLSP